MKKPTVHHLPKIGLTAALLLLLVPFQQVKSQETSIQDLSKRLEKALNSQSNNLTSLTQFIQGKNYDFSLLLSNGEDSNLADRYQQFFTRFPNTKWVVTPSIPLKDGRASLIVTVTGSQETDSHKYSLEAYQRLALKINKMKVTSKEIISAHSILKSINKPLSLTINIPDVVLTGTSYDVDIIIDQPLEESIVAGGLTNVTKEQIINQINPSINLAPMGGGGLFKSVQAPKSPGSQTWAALIAHPDGLISVTKRVRVVNKKEDMFP